MNSIVNQALEQQNNISAENTDEIIAKIIEMVESYAKSANTDMIYTAYRLAKKAHENQFRK